MMNDTFMKEKPVLPLILSMTLPMVLSMLVNSLSFITDFTLPVCCGYHPNCVFTQQAFRSGWCLECVLDHGSDYSNHFYLCLLQGNSIQSSIRYF